MSYTARNSKVTPLKDAIDAWLKSMKLQEGFLDTYLLNHWEEVMGKVVAQRTTRIYLKDGVLFLSLDSPALRAQLFQAQSKLIEKLNKAIGEKRISKIVFQ